MHKISSLNTFHCSVYKHRHIKLNKLSYLKNQSNFKFFVQYLLNHLERI
jgi:hypothetical protein